MLDVGLFRQPAFLGVQLATFCLGAGMFAVLPFLSIYLQDIDGYSPLGAGLGFCRSPSSSSSSRSRRGASLLGSRYGRCSRSAWFSSRPGCC